MAGCNLQCSFCDTEFERNAITYTTGDLLDEVINIKEGTPTALVVITGGEPMRQNIVPFMRGLIDFGLAVQIETAGTLSLSGLPWEWPDFHMVVSPKTPKLHKDLLAQANMDNVHFKYIIDTRDDINTATGLPRYKDTGKLLAQPPKDLSTWNIYLQPCDTKLQAYNSANLQCCVELALRFGYRVCIQTHKIMGVE